MYRRIFEPKLFTLLKHKEYKKEFFLDDLLAGLTVAIVALPLAMAFAIASGVGPEKGLITAIIAGVLMSIFGGSKFSIGGPTGAFVVILYDIVLRHGYEGLAIATLMAGVILILMGLFQFGSIIKYIPYPVTTGFTAGIALIIFSSQIKDFFGLNIQTLPSEFIEKWSEYLHHINDINFYALIVGIISIFLIIYTKKILPKIPGPIVAVIFGVAITYFFNIPIETIESKFGSIPSTIPAPTFAFDITLEKIKLLLPDALTIALLAAIESLLCAVVADGMSGDRHKSNTELISQGLGNIVSILFGGISATAAIARTATNIKANAKSPLAGIIHGIIIFLFMYFLAFIIIKVPMVTLAAILIVVAYNMSEIKHFKSLLKAPKSDVLVLLSTFLLTVLIDLTVAVQVGVVLAALLFIKRITDTTQIQDRRIVLENSECNECDDPDATSKKVVPTGVEVYEINGPFFFGVADKLKDVLDIVAQNPKVFILRMRHVPVIDATGIHALEEFYNACKDKNTKLILSGVSSNLFRDLENFGFFKEFDKKFILSHIDLALDCANKIIRKS